MENGAHTIDICGEPQVRLRHKYSHLMHRLQISPSVINAIYVIIVIIIVS